MKGVAPIRRTTKYLSNSPLAFKPRVKVGLWIKLYFSRKLKTQYFTVFHVTWIGKCRRKFLS